MNRLLFLNVYYMLSVCTIVNGMHQFSHVVQEKRNILWQIEDGKNAAFEEFTRQYHPSQYDHEMKLFDDVKKIALETLRGTESFFLSRTKSYCSNEDQWQAYINISKQLLENEKEAQSQKRAIGKESRIPKEIENLFNKYLQKCCINPAFVELHYTDDTIHSISLPNYVIDHVRNDLGINVDTVDVSKIYVPSHIELMPNNIREAYISLLVKIFSNNKRVPLYVMLLCEQKQVDQNKKEFINSLRNNYSHFLNDAETLMLTLVNYRNACIIQNLAFFLASMMDAPLTESKKEQYEALSFVEFCWRKRNWLEYQRKKDSNSMSWEQLCVQEESLFDRLYQEVMTAIKDKNQQEKIQYITEQLNACLESVNTDKNGALQGLKEGFNVDNILWGQLMGACKTATELTKNGNFCSRPVAHTIPSDLRDKICTILVQNRMQPNHFDIRVCNESRNELFGAGKPKIGYSLQYSKKDGFTLMVNGVFGRPGYIAIPENASEMNIQLIVALLLHYQDLTPLWMYKDVINMTSQRFETSKEYKRFCALHQLYCLLSVAIQNKEYAVSALQCISNNNTIFSTSDYMLLLRVVALHHARDVS